MGTDQSQAAQAPGEGQPESAGGEPPTQADAATEGHAGQPLPDAELDTGSPSDGQARTLPAATLNVDDLRLSLAATSKGSHGPADSMGPGGLPASMDPQSSGHSGFTLPAMDSEEHAADAAQQSAEEARAEHGQAVESELTSAQHALNDEERSALRSQVLFNRLLSCH